jgi:hypothetical protein
MVGGGNPTALSVLDRCRIRSGVVRSVGADGTAAVRSSPLVWDGAGPAVGPARDEVVRWSAGGLSLLDGLAPDDRVTLHWDWVCDKLTARQCDRLMALEERQHRALWAAG